MTIDKTVYKITNHTFILHFKYNYTQFQ